MTSRRFFFSLFVSTAARNFLVGAILLVLGGSATAQSQAPVTTRLSGHTPKLVIDGTARLVGHNDPN